MGIFCGKVCVCWGGGEGNLSEKRGRECGPKMGLSGATIDEISRLQIYRHWHLWESTNHQ